MPKFLDNIIGRDSNGTELTLTQNLVEITYLETIWSTYQIYFSPIVIPFSCLKTVINDSFPGGALFHLFTSIIQWSYGNNDGKLSWIGSGYNRSNTSQIKIVNIYQIRCDSSLVTVDGYEANVTQSSQSTVAFAANTISFNPLAELHGFTLRWRGLFTDETGEKKF